eukprot:s633_g28.t2
MTAAEPNIDEENLLKDAVGFATEHRFYLRKAVQHGDFYSAVRHSLCMANELRSCRLSPTSYYKLYSMVFLELQHLGAYLRETARHGFSLEEVFEIVQYEGNCLPRLYMLVTVGVVRMLAPDSDESPDEILRDMESMVGAVQHPVRGLFLRYFLLQVVKDKLHMLQEGALGALNFLLTTFREAVSLWHRLRLTQVQAWQLDDHRYSLRLLLGAHLMQVARVDGLTQDLYTEVVLPELLRLIPACEDAAGQEDRLQQYDANAFRFDKMKEEVADAVKEDWKRDTVDDAKKRAITTTSSYDEFRSRVAGCHLKPIHKNEFNAPAKFAFNRQVERSKEIPGSSALSTTVLEKAARSGGQTELRSIRDLDKELRRRRTAEDKAELVIHLSAEAVQRVFGREMDAEVFQQMLEALEQADRTTVPPGTARRFLGDLATLCPSSTSQAAAFFSPEEPCAARCNQMTQRLCDFVQAGASRQPVCLLPSKLLPVKQAGPPSRTANKTRITKAWIEKGAYLLQLIVEVFPDSYHLHTLDKVLATCAQVHWSIDLVQLTQHLLRRLTVHLLEGGDSSSSVTVFELFHAHFKLLHGRPRTAATPLISLLTLQLELCMFVLALHPGNACLEILEGTVDLLQNSGEGETENSAPEVLDTQLAQAVVDLMAAPLTKERLCSAVLQTPYHATLLAMLSRPMQSRAAMAMVTALLAGDVSLGDCGTLRQLFTLMSTLLQDETGQDDEDTRPRHLEHDPIAFRREQETVAQLIHQVRHEDPTKVIEMLFVLWEYFREGGPHRIIFSVPAMVSASLELADRLMHTGQNQEQECSELVRIFDFTHTLCQSLGTLIPKESLRLWLLCAASADRAAALKNDAVLAKRCSSCVDKALVCLEEDISKQEARLCGLQLFVGTLQQMKVGPEEPAKLRQRAVALCGKMLSKRFQSKAFCLCCELFWLPQPELQDPDNGLLCLRRALQSADRAIHSDPSDVGLFVDILNEVSRLFAKAAGQVSPAVLSKTVGLCIQHVRYIGSRVPVDSMRALHAILADLAAKQVDSVEAVMAGDANVSYLEVDLRPAEKLTALQSKHDVANSNSA